MIKIGRDPGNCRMAVITGIAALDMGWILAGRDCAIVTGAACTDHLSVIDSVGRCPNRVVVTILANIGRVDMRRVFPGGLGAVMASETTAGDASMIESCGQPDRRLMAIGTVVA